MTRIDEIRKRAEAASRAPWTEGAEMGRLPYNIYDPAGRVVASSRIPANVTFIAHAAADINYLLSLVGLWEKEKQ